MAKLLLIEDNADLSRQICETLQLENHSIETCSTGIDGLERLRFFEYDLAIIDWGLPEMSGLEVLKAYRSKGGRTPVLMLTGRDSVEDKSVGLDTGADDYLTKPFHTKELVSRVKALLRRGAWDYQAVLTAGNIELHLSSHRVLKDGQELKLQPKEFSLLEFLLRNPNDIFSLEALQRRVWESDSDASPETVRVCITRLRAKIDTEGRPSLIRTVPRIGYQLNPAWQENSS
jgi:DNA-binding response OmpR family regulator